jgi:hypothetical protein
MAIRKMIPSAGQTPTYYGSWQDIKPSANEGAVLHILDSPYFPMISEEKWVFHDDMWTFIPTGQVIL